MLRRKPTALTVTSEDIASFEDAFLRRLAYQRFLKTGEDPDGRFAQQDAGVDTHMSGDNAITGGAGERGGTGTATGGSLDPNDELRPLPSDRAKIVRNREERIMGSGSGSGTATGSAAGLATGSAR